MKEAARRARAAVRRSTAGPRSIRFRPLTKKNVTEFQSMVLALYREDPPGQKMSLRKIRRTIAELSSHPERGAITIIQIGDVVAGYGIAVRYWSNEYGGNIAHIDELYVKPAWRSRGVGSSYLRHVATRRVAGLKGLRVEVTPSNQKAFAFYSRHGFELGKNRFMFRRLRRPGFRAGCC